LLATLDHARAGFQSVIVTKGGTIMAVYGTGLVILTDRQIERIAGTTLKLEPHEKAD
jgi:hypothetical protein